MRMLPCPISKRSIDSPDGVIPAKPGIHRLLSECFASRVCEQMI